MTNATEIHASEVQTDGRGEEERKNVWLYIRERQREDMAGLWARLSFLFFVLRLIKRSLAESRGEKIFALFDMVIFYCIFYI